jgi:hypothetical protein
MENYIVDRYAKAKAWVNIASKLFDEWEGYNKEEQELKSKFCLLKNERKYFYLTYIR